MSYDIEANENKASRGAGQAIGNQNVNSNVCCTTKTTIISMIALTIILAFGLGLGLGLTSKENHDAINQLSQQS